VSTSEPAKFEPRPFEKPLFRLMKPRKYNQMLKFEPRSSKARKKLYERSESIFLLLLILLFSKFECHLIFAKNCPLELSESEVQ
jgi:hypothetical protein